MDTMLGIGVGGLLVALVLVRALSPVHSTLSLVELRRRREAGDVAADRVLGREEMLVLASSFRPYIEGVLLIILAIALILGLGQARGVITSLLAVPFYIQLARLPVAGRAANSLFQRQEARIFGMLYKHQRIWKVIIGSKRGGLHRQKLGSREELMGLIRTAGHTVLGEDDKRLLVAAAGFASHHVSDIMTPRDNIVAVKHNELLGPLVLDDLHKSGHSSFPVIRGDIDTIIGVLDISNLVTLEVKRSVSAEKAMASRVAYIKADDSLATVLDLFVHTKAHLLIVTDENQATAGVISLGDVIRALTGK